jgi:hypothetical protein
MSDRRRVKRRLVERTTTMTTQDFTTTILVNATPDQAFEAINNVRGWWSGQLEGATDTLGAVFEYRYKDLHMSQHKITELVRGKKVVWQTVKANLSFVKDKAEWDGTQVVFDIAQRGKQTAITFTHKGLVPTFQCYGDCSGAWGYYMDSLKELINTGKGFPNGPEAE